MVSSHSDMRANPTRNIRLRQGSSVAILGVVFLQLWLCSGFTSSSSSRRRSSTTIPSARSAENRKTVLEQDADVATQLSDEEQKEQATRMIGRVQRYLTLGQTESGVIQQLGPTTVADLERELAEDFEFVAPLIGP